MQLYSDVFLKCKELYITKDIEEENATKIILHTESSQNRDLSLDR